MAFHPDDSRSTLVQFDDEPRSYHRSCAHDSHVSGLVCVEVARGCGWVTGRIDRTRPEAGVTHVILDHPHPPLHGRPSARLHSVTLVNRGSVVTQYVVDAPSGLEAGAAVSVWSAQINAWVAGTLEGVGEHGSLSIRVHPTDEQRRRAKPVPARMHQPPARRRSKAG